MPLPVLAAVLALMAGIGVLIAGRLPDVAVPRWAPVAVAVLTAGLALALGQGTVLWPALWSAALVLPLAALATVDAATRTLPDALTFAWAALGMAHLWWTGAPLAAPLIAAAALVALGLLVDRLAPDAAVGAGDLLLLAGVILWLGFAPLLELAILAALILWAQLAARFVLARLRGAAVPQGLPLAPALALATLALWLADLPRP
jgi:prepilin signal peptidase PulO-like enzyme (type II secretory pathway)